MQAASTVRWRRAARTLAWLAVLGVAALCAGRAIALDPQRRLADFTLESWDSRGGLPHNMVLTLAQTPEGHVWAGTWEGLARYNGAGFQVFDRANTPQLHGNGVRALAVGRDGGLWVGSARGGLLRYRSGRWERWARDTGFPFDEVVALLEDSRGSLWVVGEEAGVVRLDDAGMHHFERSDGIGSSTVYTVAEGPDGAIYVGHALGVDRIDGDRVLSFGRPRGLPPLPVRAIHFDGRNGMMLSAGWALWRLDGERFVADPRQQQIGGEIASLGGDRDQNLWVGTVDAGVWRLGPQGVESLDSHLGLPQDRVLALLEDREGSMWLGTSGGLARLKDVPFTSIDRRRGLSNDYVRAVLDARGGGVWIGTSGGLNRYRDGVVSAWFRADGLSSDSLLSLAEDAAGTLWIGTYGAGVVRMRDGRIDAVPGAAPLADRQIRALLARGDGSVWLGTNAELARWKDDTLRTFGAADGLPRNYIMALAEDPAGTLWVGTSNGLARQLGDRFETVVQPPGSLVRDIFSIHVQGDGTLWLGTNDGLARVRGDRISVVRTAQGLPHNAIFQVLDDGFGYLWMCSNKGAFRVLRAQAERAADDPGYRIQSLQFGRLDGMGDSQCNGGSQPAALRAADGKLWFATAAGVSVVDPARRFDLPEPPTPIVIESLRVDGSERSTDAPIAVEAGPRKFDMEYSGLALRVPERVRYRHRLLGYDDAWTDVGSTRLATFTNLAAGDYRFEVAASSGGAWSDPPAALELQILPRWWETLWFRALLALSTALLLWLLLRWRLARVEASERRLAALVQARTRDLADQTDRLAAADREKSELLAALRQQAEALARLASEDSLTGLPNRRAFDERLARAFERARREHEPLAVALADIDHFKRINDTLSHAVGDDVLRRLAEILRRHASNDVFVARYGGEEFALLFSGPAQGDAHARCERLRREVESMDLGASAPGLRITLSLGVAHDDGSHLHHEKLLSAADEQLYAAKRAGRNRVNRE